MPARNARIEYLQGSALVTFFYPLCIHLFPRGECSFSRRACALCWFLACQRWRGAAEQSLFSLTAPLAFMVDLIVALRWDQPSKKNTKKTLFFFPFFAFPWVHGVCMSSGILLVKRFHHKMARKPFVRILAASLAWREVAAIISKAMNFLVFSPAKFEFRDFSWFFHGKPQSILFHIYGHSKTQGIEENSGKKVLDKFDIGIICSFVTNTQPSQNNIL